MAELFASVLSETRTDEKPCNTTVDVSPCGAAKVPPAPRTTVKSFPDTEVTAMISAPTLTSNGVSIGNAEASDNFTVGAPMGTAPSNESVTEAL